MQSLLGMMRKISAEPDNTARPEKPASEQDSQKQDSQEQDSQAVVPEISIEPAQELVAEEPAAQELVVPEPADTPVVFSETVIEPAPVKEKVGFIKRMVRGAISWVKRLVGF